MSVKRLVVGTGDRPEAHAMIEVRYSYAHEQDAVKALTAAYLEARRKVMEPSAQR